MDIRKIYEYALQRENEGYSFFQTRTRSWKAMCRPSCAVMAPGLSPPSTTT